MKTPSLLCPLAALLLISIARGGPLVSGDFESGINVPYAWSAKETIPGNAVTPATLTLTPVAGARTNGSGSQFLRVSGRDNVQDGPQQGDFTSINLRNALIANGNARTYTTRVWIKLDASAEEASVRCLLRWRDNGNQQTPLILAECITTGQDGWVEMTSTAKLEWVNSLTAATIDFECEQLHRGNPYPPAPTWFPSYDLDDLTMELDDDGDGLFNSEESSDHSQPSLPFSDVSDSDADRMPDDWEIVHNLNPRNSSDASIDPDGDEFTNVQEYFGATDPASANSYPGKPSDSFATHKTRALLRYLALRPWYQQALVGQMVTDNTTEYTDYVATLAAQPSWGRWPAILGLAVEKGTGPLDIVASIDHAIPYVNAGGIAQIKWAMWNPWTGGFPGDSSKIDILGLIDPAGTPTNNNTVAENLAARAVLIGWIDTVAAEIHRYNAATNSSPLLFRPISEMNGAWFWWGHRTRDEYVGLWNFIRDRLMTHHGLHNIIWIYESAQTEHVHPVPTGMASASDYYYPGNDAVDVMCHNLYDDDWVLPFDANKIYSRYPKIYGVPQAGPGKDQPDSRDGHFSNMNYITQIAARYPRMSFFIPWNSFTTNGGTVRNNIAIIDSADADDLMTDSRVITRDELRWQPPESTVASTLSKDTLSLSWSDISLTGQNEIGFRIEIGPSSAGPWSTATNTTPDATAAITGSLLPETNHWLRVRSLFDNGLDSLPCDPVSAITWSIYQQWKKDNVGDNAASDLDDDDHDGFATLLEYAMGTDPLASTSVQPFTQGVATVANADYLTLSYRRRSGLIGVTNVVEASDDLSPASWTTTPILVGQPTDNGDGTETITFRDTVPMHTASRRFMRLRVSAP